MATVNFNLRDKSESETLIILIFRHDGRRVVWSTSTKIPPRRWNYKRQRAKAAQDFPEHFAINDLLDKIEFRAMESFRRQITETGRFSSNKLKAELDEATGKSPAGSSAHSFFGFFKKLMDERRSSPQFSQSTVKKYESTFRHLREFEKVRGLSITFEDIDLDFLRHYESFLYSLEDIQSPNTIRKDVKVLKMVCNNAHERGYTTADGWKTEKFTIQREEGDFVYLSREELVSLEELKVSGGMLEVRDMFLVQCYTGLRFSDVTRIDKSCVRKIKDIEVIDTRTKKTGASVVIPLHPVVKEIIKKWKGFPPAHVNQIMNRYIKDAAKMAGINSMEPITVYDSGQKRIERKPKWELITTHTARRTFITNCLLNGIGETAIQKMTGIKDRRVLEGYNRMTQEENAISVARSAWFQ